MPPFSCRSATTADGANVPLARASAGSLPRSRRSRDNGRPLQHAARGAGGRGFGERRLGRSPPPSQSFVACVVCVPYAATFVRCCIYKTQNALLAAPHRYDGRGFSAQHNYLRRLFSRRTRTSCQERACVPAPRRGPVSVMRGATRTQSGAEAWREKRAKTQPAAGRTDGVSPSDFARDWV